MNALRAYRLKNKLTQREMAKILGVSRVTIARWEGGHHTIARARWDEISAKTGIPVEALINLEHS